MNELVKEALERERERRIVDFVMASIVAGISGSMGQQLPGHEETRELVRIGRTIYDEIDSPTEPPPEPEERPSRPTEKDIVDELFGPGLEP